LLEQKFRYHVIPTTGEPLIHVARSRRPEIVVFGHEQHIRPPKFLFAGREIMVTALENGEIKVGRFQPGQDTQYETCSTELDKVIRTIVKLGGGYAEVIQCLQEAKQAGCLEARLAVEALPKPNRKFYRDDDPQPEAPPDEGESGPAGSAVAQASAEAPVGEVRRAATPSPEFFADGLETAKARERTPEESKGTPGEGYVAPEYTQPKPGFFDRLNPLARPKANVE